MLSVQSYSPHQGLKHTSSNSSWWSSFKTSLIFSRRMWECLFGQMLQQHKRNNSRLSMDRQQLHHSRTISTKKHFVFCANSRHRRLHWPLITFSWLRCGTRWQTLAHPYIRQSWRSITFHSESCLCPAESNIISLVARFLVGAIGPSLTVSAVVWCRAGIVHSGFAAAACCRGKGPNESGESKVKVWTREPNNQLKMYEGKGSCILFVGSSLSE